MAVDLDEIDVKLLTALQEDADCTNVELARLVGLSPAATLHRVRWLKESGVIRVISAQLDPAAAGFPLMIAGSRVCRTTPSASGSLRAAAPVFERSRLKWSMSRARRGCPTAGP